MLNRSLRTLEQLHRPERVADEVGRVLAIIRYVVITARKSHSSTPASLTAAVAYSVQHRVTIKLV